jgi:hypothetical protein
MSYMQFAFVYVVTRAKINHAKHDMIIQYLKENQGLKTNRNNLSKTSKTFTMTTSQDLFENRFELPRGKIP